MIKIEMIGKKFDRLTVIEEAGIDNHKKILYLCQCICGKTKIIRGGDLRKGKSRSCGCLNGELAKKRKTTHGLSSTSTYQVWSNMLQRCNNPKNSRYCDYGGRGIYMCRYWLKFENFFTDMGERPENLTIERLDNNLGYYKQNCKWGTRMEQARNQRIRKDNKTGYEGVVWDKVQKKYRVQIMANSQTHHIGSFDSLNQAIIAKKTAEQYYWK